MTACLPDSRVLGDLFTTAAMRAVFADSATLSRYIDVEVALAQSQARLGLIPTAAAQAIAAGAHQVPLDMAALAADSYNIGYPVMPLVKQLAKGLGDAGKSLHWGATTQDIIDTACVLQVRQALGLLEPALTDIAAALRRLAATYRDTPMPGRTHLQHALPITFGYKAAIWLGMVERHLERLAQLRPRVLVLSFAGAAGTLASLREHGLPVQRALAEELQLGLPITTWHTARDGMVECVQWLGLVTGSLAKIATDVSLMMANELGEVYEPFVPGRGSSSTMPQKRNPISSEVIIANAKAVRHSAALMLESMVQDFERATGPWQAEWMALPDAFLYSAGAVEQARFMLQGLEVDPARMMANLMSTHGLVVAEAVMMGLAPALGRNEAHDVVYDACRVALAEKRPLADVLCGMEEVLRHVTEAQVRDLCNPANYLGSAQAMVDQALAAYPVR
jgi:3-carboxy-cis,cis-muconate cycloisomerase